MICFFFFFLRVTEIDFRSFPLFACASLFCFPSTLFTLCARLNVFAHVIVVRVRVSGAVGVAVICRCVSQADNVCRACSRSLLFHCMQPLVQDTQVVSAVKDLCWFHRTCFSGRREKGESVYASTVVRLLLLRMLSL